MQRATFAALILLPPIYTAAVALPLFPSDEIGVWIGAGITVAVGLLSVSSNKVLQELSALLLVALALLAVGGFAGGGTSTDLALGVADGAIIGLPFVVAAYVWRAGEPALSRVVAFQVTLFLSLAILATLDALSSAGKAVNGPNFVSGFISVNVQQFLSLGALVQGLPYPGLPLSDVADPWLLITSGLAFAGLLFVLVRPQTGRETELPTSPFLLLEPPVAPESPQLLLSWSQRDLFDGRSRPSGPTDRWVPGAAPLIGAALVTGIGLGIAFVIPSAFLLLTSVGVIALIIALVFLLGSTRRTGASGAQAPIAFPQVGDSRNQAEGMAGRLTVPDPSPGTTSEGEGS